MKIKEMGQKLEFLRAATRAIAFIVPLVTLCVGLFCLPDVRETIVGAVMGAASTAAVFYFKKDEE